MGIFVLHLYLCYSVSVVSIRLFLPRVNDDKSYCHFTVLSKFDNNCIPVLCTWVHYIWRISHSRFESYRGHCQPPGFQSLNSGGVHCYNLIWSECLNFKLSNFKKIQSIELWVRHRAAWLAPSCFVYILKYKYLPVRTTWEVSKQIDWTTSFHPSHPSIPSRVHNSTPDFPKTILLIH